MTMNIKNEVELILKKVNNSEYPFETFNIANYTMKLYCNDLELLEYFKNQMRLMITQNNKDNYFEISVLPSDDILKLTQYFSGSLYELILDDGTQVKMRKGTVVKNILYTWNAQSKKGMFLIDSSSLSNFKAIGHNLAPIYSLIARDINTIMVHGAVIGKDGKGFLISGLSGSGKSMLAAAGLYYGLEYVSDDTVLLDVDTYKAYPISSTIHLGPDAIKFFPGFTEKMLNYTQGRANKRHFDISAYSANFRSELEVIAVIQPNIVSSDNPKLYTVRKEEILMPIIYSSIFQIGEKNTTNNLKKFLKVLRKLPTYKIDVTENFEKNIDIIKNIRSD